ncbi:meiosis inhibitor protein 1 [Notothenia coriiceps]|uniref:Meiosis inhibitor protein 1 n=1 Tax=Notothenia coriiceps TaxID=8208 RepID=A0A6I9N567_9TELE|nr:PREDICTED: meiosis inhibitor protein 1 [Notothenia coriiceps]
MIFQFAKFLFDRLAGSSSGGLLWPAYSCLLLLIDNPLFFSQCHSVYGIESLVRSLNEALLLTDLAVPTQGLLLLTEILDRQPPSERLFPGASGFAAVAEVVSAGVSFSCLKVATQAASAASVLFRLNHQSRPVLYGKIEGLIEAITKRFPELPVPSHPHRGIAHIKFSHQRSCDSERSCPEAINLSQYRWTGQCWKPDPPSVSNQPSKNTPTTQYFAQS